MSLSQRFVQVDAFTDQPFTGNPAAVCILPSPRPAEWMQLVAREMNLAETAYLTSNADGYDLRWFTPACEVDLCGHATLATAHVLWEDGHLPLSATARFYTRSGLLTAERRDELIWLDFPSAPPVPANASPDVTRTLDAALGVPIRSVWRTPFDYLIEVDSEEAVRTVLPNFDQIAKLDGRGVTVTAQAGGSYDFVSRCFYPALGVPEDPVTGSAHCALGPFWAARIGRSELVGLQASMRSGLVRVHVMGDRVQLGGHAVTVARGEILY